MREAKTGHIMITKQKRVREYPIILVPRAEEDEVADLSWMIQDDKMPKKPVKKSSKRRKR